jgi:hypothetical protein
MDKYLLSYVNLPNGVDVIIEIEYDTIIKLMAFVNQEYPTYTSYQILVISGRNDV